MVLPLLTGRGVSTIRTPILIRDYLAGQGVFADDPPEELAQRRAEGAYVAQIHQRIKEHIKQRSKELSEELRRKYQYQWPRRHSFQARINDLLMLGLLVETGRRTEPEQRGAGRLGSAKGFSERVWVRVAPEAATRPEWADPLGYLIILKQSQDPSSYHNIRTPGRVLSAVSPVSQTAVSPVSLTEPAPSIVERRRSTPRAQTLVESPERLRPTPRAQPMVESPERRRPTPRAQTLVESPERLGDLEEERQAHHTSAETLSETGISPNSFDRLWRTVREFDTTVTRVYGQTPFPDLPEALEVLQNCGALLAAQRGMTQQRAQAINNCRSGARLVAEALSRALRPADTLPSDLFSSPRRSPDLCLRRDDRPLWSHQEGRPDGCLADRLGAYVIRPLAFSPSTAPSG